MNMKKITLLFAVMLSFTVFSCGQDSTVEKKDTTKKVRTAKSKKNKKKMTVERYCKIRGELRALLMEKYWPKLKGKKYSEVKDIFDEYLNDEKLIYARNNIVKPNNFNTFVRGNYAKIQEYSKTNPDYKEYKDFPAATRMTIDFTMAKYTGN